MCSLLCLLPVAAEGQVAASEGQSTYTLPYVRQKPGDRWTQVLSEGGMIRQPGSPWYLTMTNGLSDLMVMNYVDGYSFGPHSTLGYIGRNRQRWELEETIRWAGSRNTWLAKGALRWYNPIEQGVMLELHGGRHTEDFDHEPTMMTEQSLLATGLFGWNHYKLLERTDVGLRFALPLNQTIDLKGGLSWERRRAMTNHKETNVFGVRAESNEPRLRYGNTASDLVCYDGPIDGDMALLSLELQWSPNRLVYVFDDMTSRSATNLASWTLRTDVGMGKWHYASLGLSVKQNLDLSRRDDDIVRYSLSAGGILKHGEIGLADWHHLDASRFWWQGKESLTRFVLLDNYELSTDRQWFDAHVEWCSDMMLLTQWIQESQLMREYIQAHLAKVPQHRTHWELQYGIELIQYWRLGVAIGWDGLTCRGAAFTMTLDAGANREARRRTTSLQQ